MKASTLKRLFNNIVEKNDVEQLKRDILEIGLLNLDKALVDAAEKYAGKNSQFYKETSWFVLLNVLNVFDSYCEVSVVQRDLREYVRTKNLCGVYKVVPNESLDLMNHYETKYLNILNRQDKLNFQDYHWWSDTLTRMFVHTLNEKSRFVKDLFSIKQYWKKRRVNAGKAS